MVFLLHAELTGRPADQYDNLNNAIHALGNWAELGGAGWLVETERFNAAQIRDLLRPHLAESDKLFIARITKNWAGLRMPAAFPDWIKRRNFEAQ